jgi:ribonucleoside-diphosphate reductase beta chain
MAYITTSDILAMRNIGLAVMEKMTAPELQIYQARQVYEEALHTWTYQHCIESLGIDQAEIYNRYRTVPAINTKIQMCNNKIGSILRADIDLTDRAELQNFVMSYAFFAGVFEGCWFYNGFSPIFALQRRGLMKGTAEQLQYIMRDEVLHASFGIRCVNQIMIEENLQWDAKDVQAMWDEAEAAEIGYADYILKDPILGYSKESHVDQFRYIANRRAKQLKMVEPFPGAENALGWLDEQANMRKEKNFFETTVTEYQTGGALNWE